MSDYHRSPAIGRPSPPPPKDSHVYLGLAFVVLLVIGWLVVKAYTYGDWRCAFAECRLEK